MSNLIRIEDLLREFSRGNFRHVNDLGGLKLSEDYCEAVVHFIDEYKKLNKFKEACEYHWLHYGYEKQSYLAEEYEEIFGVTPKTMYDVEEE